MSNITIEFPKEINRTLHGCNGAWGDWLKKNGIRAQRTWKPTERLHKNFNLHHFSHDHQIHSTCIPNLFLTFLLQPLFNLFFDFYFVHSIPFFSQLFFFYFIFMLANFFFCILPVSI
ncbi:hypothetical protein ACOSQ4_004230 [Xanthoceras sorbifolium]